MKNNFKSGRIILLTILFIAAFLGVIFTGAAKDTIIIYYGIGGFRVVSIALKAAAALFAIGDIGAVAIEAKRYNTLMKEEARAIAQKEDKRIMEDMARRDRESVLSVHKRLSEETIRRELSDNAAGDWSACRDGIGLLIRQSEKMDDMQRRLDELLKKNGADKLDDAGETLDRVEQGLLKNIRKVLNYMEVGDTQRAEDVSKVKISIDDCIADNEKLLDNTSDFLLALTDYLNSQGEDDRDELSTLQGLKDILIQSTRQGR